MGLLLSGGERGALLVLAGLGFGEDAVDAVLLGGGEDAAADHGHGGDAADLHGLGVVDVVAGGELHWGGNSFGADSGFGRGNPRAQGPPQGGQEPQERRSEGVKHWGVKTQDPWGKCPSSWVSLGYDLGPVQRASSASTTPARA